MRLRVRERELRGDGGVPRLVSDKGDSGRLRQLISTRGGWLSGAGADDGMRLEVGSWLPVGSAGLA